MPGFNMAGPGVSGSWCYSKVGENALHMLYMCHATASRVCVYPWSNHFPYTRFTAPSLQHPLFPHFLLPYSWPEPQHPWPTLSAILVSPGQPTHSRHSNLLTVQSFCTYRWTCAVMLTLHKGKVVLHCQQTHRPAVACVGRQGMMVILLCNIDAFSRKLY